MKRMLVTLVVALATAALGQGGAPSQTQGQQQTGVTAKGATVQVTTEPANAQQQPQQPAPPPQGQQPAAGANTPTSQKVIKDPNEYNAYMTALNMQDPKQKAAAMEAFVAQYPNSIVKIDALEQALAAYQQAGDQAKVEETARRILSMNANNVRALAIVTFIDRTKATQGSAPALQETCDESQRGIQAVPTWGKPEGVSDAEFQKLRSQMTNIFEGAAGFCALQSKNYPAAKEHYQKALALEPNNMQDTYQMSVAGLETTPMDLNGFWYCAKAIQLAQSQNNPQAAQGINAYCKAKYHNYHGGDDGWDQFVSGAAGQTAPPANISELITRAPTPQELACKAVQDNDPSTLSFSDWEFILQYRDSGAPCNKDAADKVWQAIQNKQKDAKGDPAKLQIPVKVISATRDTIQAAITDDNQAANKPDLEIAMEKPMLHPPIAGATINIIGSISDYTPSPFMFKMTGGELPPEKKPAPARRPVHRRPTRR